MWTLSVPALLLTAQENPEYVLDKNKYIQTENSLFDCIYEYKISHKAQDNVSITETYHTILQVGNNTAKFWDYTAYQEDSLLLFGRNVTEEMKREAYERKHRAVYFFDSVILQNYPKGKITVKDVITPNYYLYTQDADEFRWDLSEDTLTVCGHLCQKAVAQYGGKEWTVWYTFDIPSSFGPWKLSGLPGTILQAEDREQIHLFRAISIRKSTLPMYEQKNVQQIKTSREKFMKSKIEFEKDPMNNLPSESVHSVDVIKNGDSRDQATILINGVQLRTRPNGYTPLERY